MKKFLYFIMILAAVFAALTLTACNDTPTEIENPYMSDLSCVYYSINADGTYQKKDKTAEFPHDCEMIVRLDFTLTAPDSAIADGYDLFTLRISMSEDFSASITNTNTSSTDDDELTLTYTMNENAKKCYVELRVAFTYSHGYVALDYFVDKSDEPADENERTFQSVLFTNGEKFKSALYCSEPLNFTYDEATDGYVVRAYSGKTDWLQGSFRLPDEFNGKTVTAIGDNAFYEVETLEEIYLPSTVVSIGDSAFYGCTNLVSANIPSGVTTIGNKAYYGCESLSEPDFMHNLYEAVRLPSSLESIGDEAFSRCTSIRNIYIPQDVKTIGKRAFYSCSRLGTAQFSGVPEKVGGEVFYKCNKLVSITFSGTKAQFKSLNIQYPEYGLNYQDIIVYCSDGKL